MAHVPELRQNVVDGIPLGRVAQPEEVAEAVALLASDRLAYMTAHALVLDGGWTAALGVTSTDVALGSSPPPAPS
jgi:NAD(P)-dependent dehydrogenase (short-subunit alcohol dehydrogenase family)